MINQVKDPQFTDRPCYCPQYRWEEWKKGAIAGSDHVIGTPDDVIPLDQHLGTLIREIVEAGLGPPGRLLSMSKSLYRANHPEFIPNANLYVGVQKVWYGDFDPGRSGDHAILYQLARVSGQGVRVLREMDGRFSHEESPLFDRAVMTIG